jgi:hypothetical protein
VYALLSGAVLVYAGGLGVIVGVVSSVANAREEREAGKNAQAYFTPVPPGWIQCGDCTRAFD